jgi:hypothetical protein
MMSSLSTGFTDNKVTRVDGLVIKSGQCAAKEAKWYEAYKDKSDIPYIIGAKDDSIVMTYIERSGEVKINDITNLVDKYRQYPPLNSLWFGSYISRVGSHLLKNQEITNGSKLTTLLLLAEHTNTFCHGDLSIYNIIPTTTGLKLIDPLYQDNIFGSWILDYAKLLFSLKFYSCDMNAYRGLKDWIGIRYIDILIAAECVRVATYKKQFSFIAENLINEL